MAESKKNSKPVYHAASPFRLPEITQLGQPHHDVVVELLVQLLSPLGQYRQTLPKATTKKSKKRKRKGGPSTTTGKPASEGTKGKEVQVEKTEETNSAVTDPPPAIKDLCLIGFNSVTRHLEDLSRYSSKTPPSEGTRPPHISIVFLCRLMDDLIYSHLPLLCQTASLAHPNLPPTRLVLLNPSVEPKVTSAIAQGRGVSVLALIDDPEDIAATKSLTEYVRENVEVVNVPWVKQVKDGQWLGTAIESSLQ